MTESIEIVSGKVGRVVRIDIYREEAASFQLHDLLLVNDGQDLVKMDFERMLSDHTHRHPLRPVIVAGIHCGPDRHQEYGMSIGPDFKGWGSKAASYDAFIMEELLPELRNRLTGIYIGRIGFAGFSLGGLSALDIAWNHPETFSLAAVFSGSLWWRSVDKDHKNYDPWKHRMMHQQIAGGDSRIGMKFFFECGEHDEEEDRNKNGVIDSIDDTIDLMRLLVDKGYREGKDFCYLQMPDGRHDIASWAKALPLFLEWANQ